MPQVSAGGYDNAKAPGTPLKRERELFSVFHPMMPAETDTKFLHFRSAARATIFWRHHRVERIGWFTSSRARVAKWQTQRA